MKNKLFTAVLTSISMFNEISSESDMNISSSNYGCHKYGPEIVECIHANGAVILRGTQILRSLQVNGSLRAEDALMNNLEINGGVQLSRCCIAHSTHINGSLSAENTQFQGEISIASQKIVLKKCTVNSLVVRKVVGYEGTQIVDLRDGTSVSGTIIFSDCNGEVWLSGGCTINPEYISGAEVIQK